MPATPPRQNEEEIERTINEESEVDEASLESFPASDPPGWTGGQRYGPGSAADSPDDADEEDAA